MHRYFTTEEGWRRPVAKTTLNLDYLIMSVYFSRIVRILIASCLHILTSVCLPAHAPADILDMSSLPSELKLKKIEIPNGTAAWDGFFAHRIISRIERKDQKKNSCCANIYCFRARLKSFSAQWEYAEWNFYFRQTKHFNCFLLSSWKILAHSPHPLNTVEPKFNTNLKI